MGEVHLAHDKMLDRKVALKILPEDLAIDSERMRRFVQEAGGFGPKPSEHHHDL